MSVLSIQNILIIDDSADYRKLLTTFFRKVCPSAHVEEYDPAKGRPPESFSWGDFDLLILDYDLGNGENGLEWLRQYKTSVYLVEIDKYQSLYETLGIFAKDKFVNFFIDTISRTIKTAGYRGQMTRIADSTV